ncbi:DUF2905 domain-containing protein [Methylosarcina fibrata]|uniref:DUF2905 domain-containing protein n=1 Tax=Methylosarcina fibrata TaxID=105972 RepID=UPI000365AD2E|nr:DUF2905 domain-containing protein [Methylosarcina fibrata]
MTIGKLLTSIGLVLIVVGLILTYAPGLLNWFGRLPGDIRIDNEKSVVFIPFVSMLIVSIVLSLLINLFLRK